MRKLHLFFLPLTLLLTLRNSTTAQVTCSPGGNLFVYANYDGGILNIDVNVNIPNIKIGICTYEPTTINITGAFVANVTEVRYAGYVSTAHNHCGNSPTTTTITGVNPGITSVNFLPPSTLSNPNGYSSIVCAYSCSTTSNQGGCNTADQIKDYFQTSTGGVLTSYFTQYGCWSTQPYQLSAGGNCCSSVVPCNIVANAGPDQAICPGGSVTLNGSATGGATVYSWAPGSGLSGTNTATVTASPAATTMYVLTAGDGLNCADQDTVVVTVYQPVATLPGFQNVCVDAAPFTLSGGTPSGGTYSGPGVTNGIFTPSAAGVGTHTISYSAIDGNGCTATTSGSITVNALPTVTIGPEGPFCLNDNSVVLSAGNPAGGTYTGTGVTNGIFDPGIAGVGTHNVTYAYSDQNGCAATATGAIVVNPNPNVPVLSYAAPTLSTGSVGDSIQWLFNGAHLITGGSSITPTQNGQYAAIVWVNGCPSDTSAALLVELVALEPGAGNLHFQVSPNPVAGADAVEVTANTDLAFLASFHDVMGRQVGPTREIRGSGRLEISKLSKGLYFLRLQFDGGEAYLHVILE